MIRIILCDIKLKSDYVPISRQSNKCNIFLTVSVKKMLPTFRFTNLLPELHLECYSENNSDINNEILIIIIRPHNSDNLTDTFTDVKSYVCDYKCSVEITYIRVAFEMVDETAITRSVFCGVDPHRFAFMAELEHEPHGPFGRGEILLFTLLLVHEVPRVVADYFRWHECSCGLDAPSTVWEVFDDLKTIPLL